jgi:hypothetical protein
MFNPKYHRYFALFAIATFSQAIALSSFFADAIAQPEPNGAPTQTVPAGVRSPNSKCKTGKNSQSQDRVSLGEASPLNSLPMRLQKIVAYSQRVGWVKVEDVLENVPDYKLARNTNRKVLADFERLSLFGWGDLQGEGDFTEFCGYAIATKLNS